MTGIAGTLRVRGRPAGIELVDASCGSCSHCANGVDFWCSDPREAGGVVLAVLEEPPSDDTLRTLLGLSALSYRTAIPAPVLIETSDTGAAERLAAVVLPVAALVTTDSRSPGTRSQLAQESPTGRAGTVLNVRDHAKAVRAVERGGTVVFTAGEAPQPTLTEIVQRELTVLGVDSLAPLRRVGAERLSAALAGEGVA